MNDPAQWEDTLFDDFADTIYNDLFDPFPMDDRKYDDPIEPWRSWSIVATDKTSTGDKCVLKIDRDCGKVFGVLTVYKGDEGTWDWQFILGHKK